ncbi:syringopeptin non-ribosomal peptide synthetase SypC, partial [Pseudomonas viridiflava]|nr:syringopeptin non-ribosomal peptide synthetase SypC [Pseudomonas viridiflava]
MHFSELMAVLSTHAIRLQQEEDDLVILGDDEALDSATLESLSVHKAELLTLVARMGGDWLSPAFRITPDMLPLANLSQEAIDSIVDTVPGGAGNVQDIYPLAPLQEGILYHHLTAGQGDPYVLQALFRAESRERLDDFAEALQAVIERHDILRTAMVWEGLDEPVQVVLREATLAVDELTMDAADGQVETRLREHFDTRHYRLDLREAPLMRMVCVEDTANARWVAILLYHHIAIDHAALELVKHEMQAFLLGEGHTLPETVPYRNYVAHVRLGVGADAHEGFFREMLADIDEPTLPFGVVGTTASDPLIEDVRLQVDDSVSARLRTLARRLGVNAASLHHLAWARVMGALSGKSDVVFGTVLMGRMQSGGSADRALGMFINTLPLRVRLEGHTVREGVRITHALLTALLGHEHASLAQAQRCSGVAAPTPLFNSLLNYRHSASEPEASSEALQAWQGLQSLGAEMRSTYPITLSVDDSGQGFSLTIQALAQIGAQRIGNYMLTALGALVEALERQPQTPLQRLEILSPTERQQVLHEFNDTARDYPRNSSLQELFEHRVAAQPDALAAVQDEQQLTYRELNSRANALAGHLTDLGVQPGDRVALLLERSLDLLAGQLAIIKCGAAYVPLDINAPAERQAFMLQDCGARQVLTLARHDLPEGFQRIDLDLLQLQNDAPNPVQSASVESVAYIMYTSGSTGMPKGVLVPHRAISRLVINNGYADFNAGDRVAFASNPAFDASTLDVWAPLLNGGCVVVVEQSVLLSLDEFRALLLSQSVSVLWMTAGLFHQYADGLMEAFARLRYLIVGGDVLDPAVIARVLKEGAPQHLLNGYGPTEATTFSTTHQITSAGNGGIPVGRPVGNSQVYVLDTLRQPVAVGVAGELYIGGQGVAKGYLNRPELNATQFVANPFSNDAGALLYRTGDLGRWNTDGVIEYLGRNDDQVKIRGFRIELGEIEARLGECPGVREAVVLARQDEPGQKRLVAYVVGEDSCALSAVELRRELAASLAEYMVPSAFMVLDSFPLTANGKLDRKALPVPDADAYASREFQAPEGEVEVALARLWSELLNVERVGRHDHFFELGGHSLLAVSLIERMRQSGMSADVRVLFSQPTLAALAAAVGGGSEIVVPPNLVTEDCPRITPELLPLTNLTQPQIDQIVATVPGGLANVQDIYALAPLQEGILYHHMAAEQGDPYVLQTQFAFDNRERLDSFVQALQMVIDRHDILRTGVVWDGLDSPVQVVWRKAQLHVEGLELDPADGEIGAQLHGRFDPRHYRLDMAQAPLMRLVHAEDPLNQRITAMLLFHHMVLDHMAMEVVQHEMQAWLLGESDGLAAPVPYRNYVAQARLGISQADHEVFFRDMLGDIDEPTLPFGLQDVQGDGRDIEEAALSVDSQLNLRLRAQARQQGVSAASLVHLAWAQVLGKVSDRRDVVFGTVLMGRMQAGEGADRALGMFINTLPLRVALGGQGVRAGVKSTHARLTALLAHEHASLALAQRCSGVAAPTPLFSALLNYRHSAIGSAAERTLQAWQGIQALNSEERTNYPLTLNVDDMGDSFKLTALAATSVGASRVCGYMHTALEQLVDALELMPQASLQSLSILPAVEREQLLVGFNDTALDYPQQQTIQGMFEAQVERTPDALAVVHGEERLTYRELNQQANRLAHALRKQGVQPDSRVGICVERGAQMVVGLLAILKAGGGYVPLDPAYPAERIAYMLQDSTPAAVLVQSATQGLLADVSVPVINLDLGNWQDESVQNPQVQGLTSAHLAYLIYTSGSTGLPKGVMIEHRNTVNFLSWAHTAFDASTLEKTLFSTSLNFDLAVYECFAPLTSGGSIEVVKNVLELQHGEHDIGLINTVPSALKALLDVNGLPESVHTVNVAGEALKRSLVESLFEKTGVQRLCNLYGPSETTTYSSWVAMDREDGFAAHIGKPVGNTQFYLLDEQQQPVPLGVAGEIYIGGAGVARGYLNRDDLTAERFLRDPFNQQPAARMYRTGDLGRYLPDGNIEYLGRNDDQVKIRGFRIELGEIDARLAKHPAVHEAVVTAREDVPGDKRLVAYYTLNAGQASPDIDSLRRHLQEKLPEYMVPAIYVRLDAMPLTPNGKLDRKALPAPDSDALINRDYEAPKGESETQIAAIWQDLLGVERIGRHDNFFELGGHSLLAVSLIGRMRQLGLSTDIKVLFSQPTLAALAAAVGGGTEIVVPANLITEDCQRITPELLPLINLTQTQIDQVVASVPGGVANVQDIYPLAPLQEGILYHHIAAEQGDPYVLQAHFAFDDRASLDAFVQALQAVIERHDILRTAMLWKGLDSPVQVVWRQAKLHLEGLELDTADGEIGSQLHSRFDPRHHRLDVTQAPLMRLVHAEDPLNQRICAMLLFHHIVLDNMAMAVVQHEMQAWLLGESQTLSSPVPYRNYVAQARLGVSQADHEAFFRDMLGDVDEPTLPFGLMNVQGDGLDIEEASLALAPQLNLRLRAQARQQGVSAASLVHLAWAQVLGTVSNRKDVVFGTVLMGRMQAGEGAERALGMFINTLPLRVSVGGKSVRDGVKATHERLTALLGHEHASLALAQRCSSIAAPTPLFSSLLNYRHSASGSVSEQATQAWRGIHTLNSEERTNYPLTLNVDDSGEGFNLNVLVSCAVGANRVCGYMQTVLEHLVDALEQSPYSALDSLPVLPVAERVKLLVAFNDTALDYSQQQTIHGMFEAQVERTPDALAVVHGEERLIYRELNQQANRLAHALRKQGVQPDSRVGICVERGLEMVIGLLAILKAGGGYVPLDPAYPAERIAYMLQDSAPAAVLAQAATLDLLAGVSVPVINLDRCNWQDESVQNPQVPGLTSAHLAYLIYTSGSTGLPKGVMIEHRNTVNFLTWAHTAFDGSALEKTLFSTSLNFDLAVYECFAPLTSGGSIEVVKNVLELQHGEHDIGLINTVPSALKALLDVDGLPESVHTVNVAGEALKRSLVESLFEKTGVQRLCNLYGPSETTTYSSWVAMDREEGFAAHIGKPVGNTQFYLLNEQQQPVPLGVAGEIYIGGAGVARGYLNRDDLTAERFLKDPFSQQPAARMYRTGDLGRYLPDGNIEYLGRNDDQVKIRGFRIELGEIDARLAKHPVVHEAVVTAREDIPGDKRLVAYYTVQSAHTEPDIESLRAWLQEQLPAYMIPAAYVRLEAMPLTPNGKLDRKVLPAPDGDALIRVGYEDPQGSAEITLAKIWADLLKLDRVGRHDHFFELGGHSLLAVSLIERMRQAGLSANVRTLFSQPTLAALAAAAGAVDDLVIPANGIPAHCQRITPDMLPLIDLSQEQIDQVVACVPGGAANVQDIYPLAPLQEGILYHHISAERGDPYVLQAEFAFDSRAHLDTFAKALQMVINRHDILRTSVHWESLDEPLQAVWRHVELSVEEVEFNACLGGISRQLREYLDPSQVRLDIRQAPLMRLVCALDSGNERWLATLMFHHMILDHTALDQVQHEMQIVLLGQAEQLGDSIPYRNYVAQARLGLNEQDHEQFFQDMLGDIDEPTLPFGLHDVQGDGSAIDHARMRLDGALNQRLRVQARQLGVSAASLIHLAFAQMLGRLSGLEQVVFGTILMGRMQSGKGAERALGMFINTLPLRVDLGEQGVRDGVKATHRRLTGLLGHEHASLALAQRCSGVVAPTPLFSALLNYRHSNVAVTDEALTAWSGIQSLGLADEERTNYPLTVNVDDTGEGFLFTSLVAVSIGARRVCDYLQLAVKGLVGALEQAPQTPLRAISILPDSERAQLLEHWNLPVQTDAYEIPIHQQFEARAAERPDAVALVFEEQTLSYGELNARANQVAHRLLAHGVQPDDRVAICVERGPAMIIGLLGILKSGAGYVPLDPSYPLERLAYTLGDSAPVALLSQQSVLQALPVTEVPFVSLDDADLQDESVCNPEVTGLTAASLAYVIYTSGSTGLPKGVMVEHRNVARLFSATEDWFGFNEQDVWALFHSFAFDFSVWEIWGALLHGGRLLIVPQLVSRSPEDFYNLLCSAGVTVLNQTPSAFRQLIASQGENGQAHSLRQVIFGGEALETAMLKPWYARNVNAATQLVNMYGITETTVHVTYYPLQPEDAQRVGASPIGKRIPDLQLYLLDAHGEPVPVGVIGELYVGGAGVARGYLNREALTAERFLDNPFSTAPGGRLYRTGDLGRWLADGSLEYLGRNDEQVKIRGFRIELGEIEAQLATCDGVKDARVLVREDEPGDKRLVAYVIGTTELELDATRLREQLRLSLAEYMLPGAFVSLESFPLTANGKLDRKALPVPDRSAVASRGYEAPEGDTEMAIARIWQDLLQLEQVSRHDHFFELGGHSLLAVKLIERMRQINLVADVRVLFSQPTLSALAAAVGGKGEVTVPANLITAECERITPDMLPLAALSQDDIDRVVASVPGGLANVQDIYALAPLQEGILYHHLAATEGDPYLQYALFGFDSLKRLHSFAQALQSVIARHDILRTAVLWERLDAPVQVVWRDATLGLDEHVLDPADGDIAEQLLKRLDPRQTRLDIRQAPMLRIGYAHDAQNNRWLGMLLFHHLVDDATSLRILSSEIEAHMLGQQASLPPSVPYRNYVAQAMLGVSREEHEAFFRDMLGDIDEPTLPFGLQDVQGDGRGIEEVCQLVDVELSRRLRVQARQLGVTSASLYHLAWARVLGAVSGKEDVVFGTVLLGRLQGGAGADRALGMFINTLPLRVTLGEQSVRSGLKATHARLSGLLAHEHASLVLAQRCSGVPASTPLFSSLLNFRHTGDLASNQALVAWEGIQALQGEERTNYPLTLCVDDLGEGFNLTVMAEGQIGAKRVCTYMHCVLENLVRALEQTPCAALGALNILPAIERQQLLESWNTPHAVQADDALIHRTFEAWVVAQPNAVALQYEDRTLTYAELNIRANQIAHYLLGLGVQPDDRVAICVERSLEMVVGLLGVLKSGAGYVPIDPAYPAERIAYQLQDSAPMAVLADAAGLKLLGTFEGPRVDLHSPALQAQPGTNPHLTGLSPRHLAYVIYTSGSTGLPKGVMVEHRNVARLFSATQSWFGFNEQDVWALFHSFAFDFSVWEIWGALLHGGRLLVVPQLLSRSPQDFYTLLCNAEVTVLNQTPSAFRQLLNAQGESNQRHSLRQVIFGGEALDTGMLKPWYARVINAGTQLVNMYGITETTVHVTYHPLVAADAQRAGVSPIGVRIPDLQLYVLDARREPVPVGVVGELYVGGAGVARGYLNREGLTAERFLANPFSKDPRARLYRTGDLGRWMDDGSLDYLGRNDDQVKIRGFRIEPGEIQAVLAACDTVREALVLVREDQQGDKRLVAYVIAAPDREIVAADLRAQLLLSLSDYMVPSAFVALDSFPLTANGKLDQKALPAPDAQALAMREYAPPEGDVEIAIAQIWQSLLQLPQVGRHDHFFELGGHSLLAVKLIERMRQIDLSADVRVLFSQPTLAALAAAVGGYKEVQVPDNLIVPGCECITPEMLPLADLDQAAIDRVIASVPGGLANIQDIYALAPLQEGILYHHLATDEGDPYVLQMLFAFDDRECLAGFASALQSVVERHDILRTSVVWEGLEQPVQVVWRHAKLSLEEVAIDPFDGEVLTRLRERFDPRHYRLDIGQAPLMRIAYAEDNTHQRLVGILLFHHLALDHTSLEVVVQEMQASLQGQIEQLPAPVPYRNHVAQARLGISQAEHEAFFRDMLGDIDEPTLAYGIQDVQGDGSGIEEVRQVLDSQLSSRIRNSARQLGVSAASLAHLAWAQVAGRVSGREEVVFGTVLMGRMQGGDGADRALGMFINTLPLRISVGSQSALAAVKLTHQRLSTLLGHEHASLSLAQRCSGVPSSLPLFSTLFNYRHSNAGAASTDALSAWQGIQTLSMEERTNYPLTLNVDDLGDDFILTVQAVQPINAQRIGDYMQVALRSLVEALEHTPQAALNSLSILPDDERELLLAGFNDTAHPYPRDVLIHQLIEQQAAECPDACAVRGDSGPLLTYAELNQQANQ